MEQKQQSPVLWIALVIAAFAVGTLWTKVSYLEKGGVTKGNVPAVTGAPQANVTSAPTESPLAVTALKAYAKELKLDTNKFNTCLDSKNKEQAVKDDIAYGQSVGVNGTPAFFVNGKFVSGAQPFEVFKEIIDKEIAGTGSEDITTYSTNLQNMAKQQGFDPKKKQITVASSDPVKGPAGAKVTLVEFSDFECPFCARAYPTVNQVMSTYGTNVRLVYKQYPLPFHPNAQGAAEASLCAADQGKFWEMHDRMFVVQQG